jgi:ribosomal protein S18 acetylase RimI-like enzyme
VVEIRDSRPGDAEALAAMWLEEGRYYAELDPDAFQSPTEDGLAEWIEEGLARARLRQGIRHLVAELEGQVAGYILVRIEPDTDPDRRQIVREVGERRAVIDALGTAEAFQRRGVATALVEAAENWAREQGATRV